LHASWDRSFDYPFCPISMFSNQKWNVIWKYSLGLFAFRFFMRLYTSGGTPCR
jgi:hypothetical protein